MLQCVVKSAQGGWLAVRQVFMERGQSQLPSGSLPVLQLCTVTCCKCSPRTLFCGQLLCLKCSHKVIPIIQICHLVNLTSTSL